MSSGTPVTFGRVGSTKGSDAPVVALDMEFERGLSMYASTMVVAGR